MLHLEIDDELDVKLKAVAADLGVDPDLLLTMIETQAARDEAKVLPVAASKSRRLQ